MLIIRGINDNRLISNPIQTPIKEVEEIDISIPIVKQIKNKSFEGLKIKKKRIIPLYLGYEPKSLISLSFTF